MFPSVIEIKVTLWGRKQCCNILLPNGEDKFLKTCKYHMFFYLHCSRGFNCLYGGRTKRCIISCPLCGNPWDNFGPHKAPRHTLHIRTSLRFMPIADHTRHRRFVGLRPGQCLLWHVSSLPMLVEAGAVLPTGMDGRGSCPARASISLIRKSRKSLCEIFFPLHEDVTVGNDQV